MEDAKAEKPVEASDNSQFINRLAISKIVNLGNYENRKIEISVNFSKPENAGSVLTELERIIDDYNCTKDVEKYNLNSAKRILENLDDYDSDRIERAKTTIADYDALVERQRSAVEKLNSFGGVIENRGAKESWDDEDDENPY